jgi:hypothetical protein
MLPPAGVKKTLGVWLGGDKLDINNWQIPRTDSTTAPNSEMVGPLVQEVDWQSASEVRVLKTPDWGVTVYIPHLGTPGYQGEIPGVPGRGHATETTVPSAGWINVEVAELPKLDATFGGVFFGALDPVSISQQWWDWFNYKIFKDPDADYKSPEHMVLNQANIITSGERTLDVTLETVILQVLDEKTLSLVSTHLYPSEIYKVVDGDTIFASPQWDYDSETQVLRLRGSFVFSSSQAQVTVLFPPGRTVTTTYLEKQPLLDGVTLLNEGTPPIPRGQTEEALLSYLQGEFLSPAPLGATTAYQVAAFTDDPEALYEGMQFLDVTNEGDTGLITTPGEGTLPSGFSGFTVSEGEKVYAPSGTGPSLGGTGPCAGLNETGDLVGHAVGAHVLEFSGRMFWESIPTPQSDLFMQGLGTSGFSLMASGGSFAGPVVDSNGDLLPEKKPLGGTIGPGGSILYPLFPSLQATIG